MVVKGELSKEDYSLTCIVCGSQEHVALVPHRVKDKVSGIYCFCETCFPQYAGATLRTEWIKDVGEVVPKDAAEALITSTNTHFTEIAGLQAAIAWIKSHPQEGVLNTAIDEINAVIAQIRKM